MKISTIELTETEKKVLEQGYKAKEITNMLGTNIQSVHNWVKR